MLLNSFIVRRRRATRITDPAPVMIDLKPRRQGRVRYIRWFGQRLILDFKISSRNVGQVERDEQDDLSGTRGAHPLHPAHLVETTPCVCFRRTIVATAIVGLVALVGVAGNGIAAENGPAAAVQPERPTLLSKEVFLGPANGRPAAAGFICYAHKRLPVLMHCFGRQDYSDGYDDYAIQLSTDNGRTWSVPQIRWKSTAVPEGRMRYAEPAAFFDPEREKLVVLIDRSLHPNDKLNVDTEYGLELNIYDPAKRKWTERRELKFPGHRTPAMSFSFPIKTTRGELLFPGMRKTVDDSGKAIHYRGTWAPVDEVVTVIGAWKGGLNIEFELGEALRIEPERSSRGLDENTVAELPDGRIAAICRGDNSAYPDEPGYKWLSFSSDKGRNWTAPVPLPATGGDPIESGANGSALFRSIKNHRLYWLGNLALRGERAKGNWPRSPLCLVEVREEPFALKRETIFSVDERNFNDSPRVQMSNFRFYQDRENGDVVIFLTRYAEVSEKHWMLANYYRYRVGMP